MSLSVQSLLENKGYRVKAEHVEVLEFRWQALQTLKGNLENANVDDADIGLRNIPGGDHIE
ncbi:hypothetical protein [Virgibacillus ainsalahensis]